jgi:hypothetical protein
MDANSTYGRPIGGKSVTVAYTGTAGTTAALPEATLGVRVMSTTDCFIEIGLSPTAVANTGMYLPAFTPEYFEGQPNVKVSAIQLSAAGSLYVTPF